MHITTKTYKRCEIVLKSEKEYSNPFMDVDIDAVFTHSDGTQIALPGFWNGENEWKVRFSAEKAGVWKYTVTCTDKENLSLTDSGEIEAVAGQPETELEKHGYVRLEEGKRYFVYGDGTPFFYLADTHWQMPDHERLHECNYPGCNCGNQFKHLADDRIKKGFTVYQTYFAGARQKESPAGTPPWWTEQYTLINPKIFNETMDVMIEYLAQNGITVALGFGTHTGSIFCYGCKAEPALRFARYCVARYACYPLMWITGQEITDLKFGAFDIWCQVGQYVSELDGYKRPNSAHMYPMKSDDPRALRLDSEPWHQWWTLQSGHGGKERLQKRFFYESYYKNEKIKPFVEAECQYEDIYCEGFCGHDASRIGGWIAMQSGSAGYTYGSSAIWVLSYDQKNAPFFTSYSPDSWYEAMDKPGSVHVGYMRDFYKYVDWTRLEPVFDYSCGVFESRKEIAISRDSDKLFIFYLYGKEEERGYITGLRPNTAYKAKWFDPINNYFVEIDDVITPDGKLDMPKRPTLRDWALVLSIEDLGEYETRPYPVYPSPVNGKTVTPGEKLEIISVTASSEDDEHPAVNLIDGNPDTYWEGFQPKTSQRLDFDLGKTSQVKYLRMDSANETMYYFNMRIFGSNDGENFDMLMERNNRIIAVGGQFKTYYEVIKGEYRYIRLFINSDELAGAVPKLKLSAIEIYKD